MLVYYVDSSPEPYITPKDILSATEVIKALERLALTIRILATEETYHSLSFQFRTVCAWAQPVECCCVKHSTLLTHKWMTTKQKKC